MRFEVLGFAGAAPLQGACPSYLITHGGTAVLLDCGPGALERLWRRAALRELDAIVISHMHADHVLDLLPFAGDVVHSLLAGRRPELYVPRGDGRESLARLHAAFAREPGEPSRFDATFEVRQYDAADEVALGELSLSFAATAHQQPCFAVRVSDGRAALVYGADGAPSATLAALARGADLLVAEASYLADEPSAQAHGHMTAAQAGQLAAQAGAARLLLTHTFAGVSVHALRKAAAGSFSGPVEVAREGYCVEL